MSLSCKTFIWLSACIFVILLQSCATEKHNSKAYDTRNNKRQSDKFSYTIDDIRENCAIDMTAQTAVGKRMFTVIKTKPCTHNGDTYLLALRNINDDYSKRIADFVVVEMLKVLSANNNIIYTPIFETTRKYIVSETQIIYIDIYTLIMQEID